MLGHTAYNMEFGIRQRVLLLLIAVSACALAEDEPECIEMFGVIAGSDCRSYWVCDNYRPYKLNCPTGTRFNLHLRVCVHEGNNNDCGQNTIDEPSCKVGSYIEGDDCVSFQHCSESGPGQILYCPDGLKFSVSLSVCVWPGSSHDDCVPYLSGNEIEDLCARYPDWKLPHRQCQLFYDCRLNRHPYDYTNRLTDTRYTDECPYPQLYSVESQRCKNFEDVDCGERIEFTYGCEYMLTQCPVSHCIPCVDRYPDCRKKNDGQNPFQSRLWSPYYVMCRSERSVELKYCTKWNDVLPRLFSPDTNQCETLYNIPKKHQGFGPACESKSDGYYTSVEGILQYYYKCESGNFDGVYVCDDGEEFNEYLQSCMSRA